MDKNKVIAIKIRFDETDIEYWLARELMPEVSQDSIEGNQAFYGIL